MPTQVLSGHLPMLMHADPRDVLVIGFGSGITAGSVARYPVQHLDIVEIEPAVLEAGRFFEPWNAGVRQDPRVRSVVADGRNFLLTTAGSYDVIISEPSNPWVGGLASLFSRGFFVLTRQRLRPGGVMVQWLQAYGLAPEDFRMIARTFQLVFPATTLWHPGGGDYLLVGQAEATPLDLRLIERRFQDDGVRRQLGSIGIAAWPNVLGHFMLTSSDVAHLARGAQVNTDDRLPLEFSAPRAFYERTTERNWQLIRASRTTDVPEVTSASEALLAQADVRHAIGRALLAQGLPAEALAQFETALRLDATHTQAQLGAVVAQLGLGHPDASLALIRGVLAREPANVTALALAGLAAGALRMDADAVRLLERAARIDPHNPVIQRALVQARGSESPEGRRGPADVKALMGAPGPDTRP